jgi:O-methyltransferase
MSIATLRTTTMPWVEILRSVTPPFLWQAAYSRLVASGIPDAELYRLHYSPWLSEEFRELYAQISPHTVVSIQRAWTLWQGVHQAMNLPGDVAEAGVFRGGTAKLLAKAMVERPGKQLFLFDSFEGMVSVSADDRHAKGDFSDTSLEGVQKVIGDHPFVEFRKGWVPATFEGLEQRQFCFVHIDLDLHDGVLESLRFFYPRMSPGGIIVLDDYGFASCPGARAAADEFFADKPERLLALSTAQAIIHKL